MQQFALALKADPSMDGAEMDRLLAEGDHAGTTAPTPHGNRAQDHQPAGAAGDRGCALPEDPLLRRLPPIKVSQPSPEPAQLPGISYDSTVVAPLPPVLSNSQTGATARQLKEEPAVRGVTVHGMAGDWSIFRPCTDFCVKGVFPASKGTVPFSPTIAARRCPRKLGQSHFSANQPNSCERPASEKMDLSPSSPMAVCGKYLWRER